MSRHAPRVAAAIGATLVLVPAFAADNLMLTCEVKAIRLCQETLDDDRCGPWRPPADDVVFGVSRIDDKWKRFGEWEADLTLIQDDDEILNVSGYRFSYSRHGGQGFLAISRSSGDGMDVYQGGDSAEIEHSMIHCRKVENQW